MTWNIQHVSKDVEQAVPENNQRNHQQVLVVWFDIVELPQQQMGFLNALLIRPQKLRNKLPGIHVMNG
jgi:hypothetical protein